MWSSSALVAEALIGEGAHCVNDVSGGTHDAAMLPTVARLGVPAVLMHMRGEPATMASLAHYTDVVAEVRSELLERLHAAEAAGLPRWSLISDPGIGFAKDADHNLALMRHLGAFSHAAFGYPMLLGVSRKAFIGRALAARRAEGMTDGADGVETPPPPPPPRERVWGTGAACALGVPHADILRVHDVAEMRDVAAVADAIMRPAP